MSDYEKIKHMHNILRILSLFLAFYGATSVEGAFAASCCQKCEDIYSSKMNSSCDQMKSDADYFFCLEGAAAALLICNTGCGEWCPLNKKPPSRRSKRPR